MMTSKKTMAALLVALLGSSSCTFAMYEKGMVKRIDVDKKATEPILACSAGWEADRGLKIKLTKSSQVELNRTVHYNTILWEGEWVWWAEPLELITSPLYLPLYIILVAAGVIPIEDEDVVAPTMTKVHMATAAINPAASIFAVDIVRTENTDIEVFADEPRKIAFGMKLPVKGVELEYRVLDEAGAELGAGSGTTDVFGEVVVSGVEAKPAAVEIKVPGLERTIKL